LISGGLAAGAGWLLAAMVASTAISAYVYLRVVGTLFRSPEATPAAAAAEPLPEGAVGIMPSPAASPAAMAWERVAVGIVLVGLAAGLIILGLFPSLLLPGLEGLLPLR